MGRGGKGGFGWLALGPFSAAQRRRPDLSRQQHGLRWQGTLPSPHSMRHPSRARGDWRGPTGGDQLAGTNWRGPRRSSIRLLCSLKLGCTLDTVWPAALWPHGLHFFGVWASTNIVLGNTCERHSSQRAEACDPEQNIAPVCLSYTCSSGNGAHKVTDPGGLEIITKLS